MIWEREKKVLTTLTRTYKCFWLAQRTITVPLGNNTRFRSLDNGHIPYHRDTRTDRIDIGRILTINDKERRNPWERKDTNW